MREGGERSEVEGGRGGVGSGGVAMYILYIQYVHIHTHICTYIRT